MTLWYRAPEVLMSTGYDTRVDVWSLGCIFAELITQKPLFEGQKEKEQLEKIFEVVGLPEKWPENAVFLQSNFAFMPKQAFSQVIPGIEPQAEDLLEVCQMHTKILFWFFISFYFITKSTVDVLLVFVIILIEFYSFLQNLNFGVESVILAFFSLKFSSNFFKKCLNFQFHSVHSFIFVVKINGSHANIPLQKMLNFERITALFLCSFWNNFQTHISLQKMLNFERDERISASMALSHPYFEGLDPVPHNSCDYVRPPTPEEPKNSAKRKRASPSALNSSNFNTVL